MGLQIKNLARMGMIRIGLIKEKNNVVHIDRAYRTYAKTIGKNVKQLTPEEKQLAVMCAVRDLTTD